MPAGTSLSIIYTTLGLVIRRATGRRWWRKASIQAQPNAPYATVYLQDHPGLNMPVVSHIEHTTTPQQWFAPDSIPLSTAPTWTEGAETLAAIYHEIPWGTSTISGQVEFFRSSVNDTAFDAARRFAQSLYLTEREWDLWRVCALSGPVKITDISGMFRADIEARARVEFRLMANLIYPEPLADIHVYNIETQPILIDEYASDDDKQDIDLTVDDEGERGTWPIT